MKKLLLIPILIISHLGFSQIIDQFNYSGALNANGWTTHSGTSGQFQADNAGSLTYPNLPASVGNKAQFVAGNSEDVNYPLTGISGVGYYSFIMNVPDTAGMSLTGQYFTGFGQTAGATVTVFAPRIFIRRSSTSNAFQLGVQNTTGGTPTQTYSGDLPVGTSIFVVVKLDASVSPIEASVFINPVLGGAEPAATITNNSGTATFSTFASIFLRQAGSGVNSTGSFDIDEIRAGSTWASVTPSSASPCTPTTATIDTTACQTYTVPSGDETYTTAGTYMDTLVNAGGCDSIITINLSFATSSTYYIDNDGDSYGDLNTSLVSCSQPVGYVLDSTDCDDTNDSIYPGAPDVTGNSIDENCDGVDGTLGIDQWNELQAMVYPNPGTNEVIVSNIFSGAKINVISVEGKEVAVSIENEASLARINTTNLETGTYLIKITAAQNVSLIRWIKK